MIPFGQIKTIFFDYDGTIHNTISIYGPAFRKAYQYLVDRKLANPKEWSDDEISYWLGFNASEMWQRFMPHLDEQKQQYCRDIIGAEMKKRIINKEVVLYEKALETLQYLKDKGYRLIFISNCRIYYRDIHRDTFSLERYFERMICSEEHEDIPKYQILEKVIKEYPKEMVIVGDRIHDIEAGKKNGIYTIGCEYGFAQPGELDEADYLIKDITQLKELF